MRLFLVLLCSVALATLVGAQEPPKGKEKEKRKGAPAGQVSRPGGRPAGQPAGVGRPAGKPEAGKPTAEGKIKGRPSEVGKPKEVGKPAVAGKEKGTPTEVGKPATAGKAKGKPTELGKPAEAGTAAGKAKGKATGKPTEVSKPTGPGKPGEAVTRTAGTAAVGAKTTSKPIKPQHFDLPKQANTAKAPAVTFQQGRHIEGSQNWQGEQYTVFRNYHSEWHDEGWWHNHYGNNIVFMFGAPYFLNAGYWFPAWGYTSNAYYAYDGPIYAYNNLPPDQVIANVQSALQEQGYYQGEIDGLLGPQTRAAIADYQRNNGLEETAAIDQPTLQSLGMA